MKLLYILGSYFPAQSGGPNNTIHWQAKYLVKSGVDVTVASLKSGLTQDNINDYGIQYNESCEIEGVNAYYFNYTKNRYLSVKFYLWMIKNIRQYNFVQLTSYFFPITWFAVFLCILYKIPYSIAPRGELEDNALKYSSSLKKLVDKILLRRLYKKAKFIMVTSKQELEFCKRFFPSKMNFELIPNYIDLSASKELSDKELLEKKDILYLGRLHPKKGIENLINAYVNLNEEIKKRHRLLIVGTGLDEYQSKLRELVSINNESNVIFLGHKQGKEKEKLYQNSKLFVLPSYSENFGNVVLESLSFSTPVISSIYTPWQELETRQSGFFINNTPDVIQNHIKKVLDFDKDEYYKYANNARKHALSYDIEENIDHLKKTYEKYVKQGSKDV